MRAHVAHEMWNLILGEVFNQIDAHRVLDSFNQANSPTIRSKFTGSWIVSRLL
jgi:hypothetical protein